MSKEELTVASLAVPEIGAAHWGSWGARERDVTFPRQQAGGGIEADPADTRQVNLRPSVQIGEVLFRAGRAVEGFDVRLELNQVPGDEPSRQSEVTEDLHQEPALVAARPATGFKGLLAGLDAVLHADDVADVRLQSPVQGN